VTAVPLSTSVPVAGSVVIFTACSVLPSTGSPKPKSGVAPGRNDFHVRSKGRGGKLESRVFLWMSVEAIALALVFGLVIGTVTARLLSPFSPLAIGPTQQHMGVGARLMLSLGAGLYEELLFRVLLVSGLLLLARRVLRWRPALANTFAVVTGALIFSAFHYVGAYGDPFRLDSFVFRAIAGVAFSALYVFRGFGITAWTHAIYDILVLVF